MIDRPSKLKQLCAQGLACRRGGRRVFEDLSFVMNPGDLLILRGPNGTGKSSLLRVIAGLVEPSSGHIDFDGEPVPQHLVYCGHLDALKSNLTLAENLEDWAAYGAGQIASDEKIQKAAAFFHLEELLNLQVRYFSSGQRHRASLTRLLLADRPIWLLDEPTVGLDSENRQLLSDLISRKLELGGLILAATHDPLGIEGAVLNLGDFQIKKADWDDQDLEAIW